MADPPPGQTRSARLDASGPQEVVYCHQCEHEWYKDRFGLTCPQCGGEATEIVSPHHQVPVGECQMRIDDNISTQILPGNDPRERDNHTPDPVEDLHQLHDHNPWSDDDAPDPDEGDVEEYTTHGPGGRTTTYFSQTFTSRGSREPAGDRNRRPPRGPDDPTDVIRDFQSMIGAFMGPNLRQGRAGRSSRDALFPHGEPGPFRGPPFGGRAGGGFDGPHIVGQRFTFTTSTGGRPRDPEAVDAVADEFATILGGLFNAIGPMGPIQHPDGEPSGQRGMPLPLQGLLASLLNPANAVAGDAVYSQEALDRIISTLMEQHPQSNAPGPASEEAIANLPKRNLDEKMLGPELKAECSVCMDDVTVGDEVVVLPCTHWFHEACATAWLKEHNTCPICRTGIGGEQAPLHTRRTSQGGPSPPGDDGRARRGPFRRSPPNLNTLRDRGRLSPTLESSSRRFPVVGENRAPSPHAIHSGHSSSIRMRDSEISENQRETRRNTSGSDRSHRSSNSGNTGESGGSGGPINWIRNRLGRRPE